MRAIWTATAAILLGGLSAHPAEAQTVTGQVNLSGFVAPRCGSTFAGDSSFTGAINLGELTQTDGTLSPALADSSTTSPAGVATFTVGCTSAGSRVTLSATRLSNPATAQLPTSSNDIDYTAEIKIAMAAGGFGTVTYRTAAALPAATSVDFTGVYANQPSNFEVRVYDLEAENGPTSFLVVGSYTSTISITVSPN